MHCGRRKVRKKIKGFGSDPPHRPKILTLAHLRLKMVEADTQAELPDLLHKKSSLGHLLKQKKA
jgi:hypothetical protein